MRRKKNKSKVNAEREAEEGEGRQRGAHVYCGAELANTRCVSGMANVYWVPGTMLSLLQAFS